MYMYVCRLTMRANFSFSSQRVNGFIEIVYFFYERYFSEKNNFGSEAAVNP